jgi:hypothetical protein
VSVDATSGGGDGAVGAGSSESGVVCGGGENSAQRRATGVGVSRGWPAELRHYCR